MIGYFDPKDKMARVQLKISGTTNKEKTITALFDTGHSGSISLPLIDLVEIGAQINSFSLVKYADGRSGIQYLFSVNVDLDGFKKEVKAGLIPSPNEKEALVGLELFSSYIISIDAANDDFQIKKR